MAFTLSSTKLSLDGAILTANCRASSGTWSTSSLDLNGYLGNLNGAFNMDRRDFTKSAYDIQLHGNLLRARLKDYSGAWVDAIFNLDLCVANHDGSLRFRAL